MRKKLSLAKRVHVWWIVLRETRNLAVMATMPVRDIEAYAQFQALPEKIKQLIPATLFELGAGRKPYEAVNAIIDAFIERSVPDFRHSMI